MTTPVSRFGFGAIDVTFLATKPKQTLSEDEKLILQIASCNQPNVLEQVDFYFESGCYTLTPEEKKHGSWNPVSYFESSCSFTIYLLLQIKEKEIRAKWPGIDLKKLAYNIFYYSNCVPERQTMVYSLIEDIFNYKGNESDLFHYVVGWVFTYNKACQQKKNKEEIEKIIEELNQNSQLDKLGEEILQKKKEVSFLVEKIEQDKADGRHKQAQETAEAIIEINEKIYGLDSIQTARAYYYLANLFQIQGNSLEAKPLYERILKITEETYGPNHLEVAADLNNLALVLEDLGNYKEAKPLLERALKISKEILGPNHTEISTYLANLGLHLLNFDKFQEAEPLLEQALQIDENFFGPSHPDVAISLTNLARFFQKQGNYEKAESLFKRALRIREESLGQNHFHTAISMRDLALLLKAKGNYEEAKSLLERALEINEGVYGSSHPEVGGNLNDLANLLEEQGNYEEAKLLFERVLEISEEFFDNNHPNVATSLGNFARLLKNQGNYEEAKSLYERSLKIDEEIFGLNHPKVAVDLNNFAGLLQDQGNYEEAQSLYERALRINEETFGSNNPLVAMSLGQTALIFVIQGNYEEAKSLYERSLKIYENFFGPNHFLVATNLNRIAIILTYQGKYKEAKPLFERALKIKEEVFGPSHLDVLMILNNMAFLFQVQGYDQTAKPFLERALKIQTTNAANSLLTLSERERLAYLQRFRFFLNNFLSLFVQPEDNETAYTALLQWKGISGQLELAHRKVVLENPELQKIFDELNSVRLKISNLVYSNFDSQLLIQREEELKKLTQEKEKLERELLRQSDQFKKEQLFFKAGFLDVAQIIPENTVVVDYFKYQSPLNVRDGIIYENSYVAFVIIGGTSPKIHRIELGPANEIETKIADYRDKINAHTKNLFSDKQIERFDQQVRAAIWDPVKEYIDKDQTVLIVPDAAIAGISFAGLRSDSDHYLIEDYTFGYLENALDLVRFKMDGTHSANGALVVGNVDYNNQSDDVVASLEESRSVSCGLKKWAPLPSTEDEIKIIDQLLTEQNENVRNLKEAEATESTVKREVVGKRYLHFATHGFFATNDNCPVATNALESDETLTLQNLDRQTVVGYNPMVLSGIVLAGVNQDDSSQQQDGILTAEEVAGLDLRGTELVVLSACQTGLGEVKSGEGVLGLRRAFMQAGAKSMVMSLWNALDEPTQQLMQNFYEELFSSEKDTLKALRQAQLKMLENNRKQFNHGRPYTWAEFIASGSNSF